MIPSVAHLPIHRLRLPVRRHIPGSNSVPELDYLNTISSRTASRIGESRWRCCLPYRYGWFLFCNQYYWEAHEMWEAVWQNTRGNSRERFLLQGLIQLANAGLKHRQGNLKAFERILKLVPSFIDAAFPPLGSTDTRKYLLGVSKPAITALESYMHNIAYK